MQRSKKIIVSVSNDITHDQRVHRICSTLVEVGFDVLLVGRKLRQSAALDGRQYRCKRIGLLFNKGFLFYAELNIRLFFFILFRKCNLLLSNDLDTLPANSLASFFKRKKLFYDSHELFTEVPELNNRKLAKKVWLFLESACFNRVHKAFTVCDSIANIYHQKYGKPFATIRNLPFLIKKKADFKSRQNRIIYQGALNKDRGIEMMIEAMQHIEGYELVIAGKGDIEEELVNLRDKLQLTDKVKFVGKLASDPLVKLTSTAKLGLSLERNTNLNYYYALPNKVFDYINAGVPVLCSNLPEMASVVKEYKVGELFEGNTAIELAKAITKMLGNLTLLEEFHQNCKKASEELCWEKEKEKLMELFVIEE